MNSILQRSPHAERAPGLFKYAVYALAISVFLVRPGFAQEEPPHHPRPVTPLAELLKEAEQNNPQIQAAQEGWQAAKQVPPQVTALPDPQVQLQQVNVGSPRPFAGYTTSDFAYVGLGASMDIPYPGKLKLRGEVAKRDADIANNRSDSVSRAVLAEIKAAYFQLGYLAKTLALLQDDGLLLKQIEQASEARYRTGMGSQQDVLQAQVQKTKLLREISMHHLETGKVQTRLKQLLNRPQSAPDIEASSLAETPLDTTFDQLLSALQAQNPDLAATQNAIAREKVRVDAAHKDFYPDFNIGYMFDRTDPEHFRSYNQITFGIKIPLHYEKQRSELAQAEAELSRSRDEHEAQSQQAVSDLHQQYLIAEQAADVLKIYREGLIPQSHAAVQSGLAAYRSNRQDFQPLLTSYLDVLHLEQEKWQSVADHETALARLEQMTGLPLRPQSAGKE
jgi:cobalt-zinc-cadmium efflux system outer membrane protein